MPNVGRIRNVAAYNRTSADAYPTFVRRRFTAAEINAGTDLVETPASNIRYRLHDCTLIAIGGAVTGATDVRLLGTQGAASVALATVPIAGLTQSTVVRLGSAQATVLANGASLAPCDLGTPIRIGKTGGTLAGATHVDVIATVVLE
jgi:hypothetical protein